MSDQATVDRIEERVTDGAKTVRDGTRDTYDELNQGAALGADEGGLPLRSVGAMAVFVAVFTIVYILTWTALDATGLVLGILTGGIAAALAVKAFAKSSYAGG